jgi:tetratricopeptide (TPR) repeat protein
MPQKALHLEPLAYRIVTMIAGMILVAFLLLASTWFFGDAVAGTADNVEMAEFSQSMASGNPKAHLVTSLLREKSFSDEDQKAALKEAEYAAFLSPNDYALWQSVARLRERSGDIAGAEAALRKALELAPSYVAVKWALGNVVLRQNRNDEAFKYIRGAVEGDPRYAPPAAAIAWDVFDGDLASVEKSIGKSTQVRSAMAVYLVKQDRFDEALRFWKTVPENQRKGIYLQSARKLFVALTGKKKYRHAVAISKDLRNQNEAEAEVGKITNGGFEDDIPRSKSRVLDWNIEKGDSPSIGISVDNKASGKKSLAFLFDGGAVKTFRTVSQIIALNGSQEYRFSFKYKSELETEATMFWQIRDSVTSDLLGTSKPIDAGSAWAEESFIFSVPEESSGVILRLLRENCPERACPISGTVWFDDLEVK